MFNTHEALQILEDEGFFTEVDIVIQPPGDGMESEEDTDGEEDNDVNRLSGNQFLAETDAKIEYDDGCIFNTFEEDKIENEETNNDSSDGSTDFTMKQTKVSVEKNNKINLNPSKIYNEKVMDKNKKPYLSNENGD